MIGIILKYVLISILVLFGLAYAFIVLKMLWKIIIGAIEEL